MTNILEKILNDKKQSLELIKKEKSLDSLDKNIKNQNFLNFKDKIKKNKGISLISEIKKASPSAGILIENFNHLDIAKIYIENGATCLSVLTEEKHFLGKLEYIQDIKRYTKIFRIPSSGGAAPGARAGAELGEAAPQPRDVLYILVYSKVDLSVPITPTFEVERSKTN